MSWVRDRLGLKTESEEDKYGIRARLGLTDNSNKNAPQNFASRNQNMDNLLSQRNIAAEKLMASRKNYQDYIKEETKEARSQTVSPLSSQPTYDLAARRSQMEQLAIQNAQAQKKATSTKKAKELKQDIKQKQSEYNYANYLKNQAEVENTDYNFGQKIINPIVSGAADLLQVDRLDPESQYYFDEQGNKTYLPTKRSLKQQAIRQQSGGVLGVYNDVAYNMSKAVSSKVLDMATLGGGTALYYGDILSDSTEEAKKQGFNNTEALAYGAGVTVMAKVLDDFIGSFGGLSNVNNDIPTLSQGLDKLFMKLTTNKTASTILSNMTSEALSEYYEEFADNALKYIINSDKSGYDSFVNMLGETLPDAIYSGLIGGISGGVGGTIENITNSTELQERKQALEDYRTTLENYKPQTIEEANYKNDELNKVDEGINQIEQREEELQQTNTKQAQYQEQLAKIREEQRQLRGEETVEEEVAPKETTQEVAPKEQITKTEEVKEPKQTYPNAQNIQQEEGYTAYYDVPAEDYIDLHGRKSAYDIDASTLNNTGFDLITYNDNGTRNIYEFDTKKDLNKYIKSIGGYSALEGQYTIMSNTKEGEFYYVRDKYAKGGWQWEDNSGRIVKGSELRTTKLERERQKQLQAIDNVAKESQLTPKATKDVKQDVESIVEINEKSPVQNMDEGTITITNKGINPNLDEKMQEDVLKITTPSENPKTVTIGEYQVKTPSAKNAAKDLSEQVGYMIDNLSTKEKQEIQNETRKKRAAFQKAQNLAENMGDEELSKGLSEKEAQAYYNQLDISANFFEKLDNVYKDLDQAAEDFDVEYLNVMAGTPDGEPLLVSNELVAKGQALATYYLDKHMVNEAADMLVRLSKLGTASGQASAQFNAMYQYTPYGILSETISLMEKKYNEIANRKGVNSKWARENNPNTNPNSKFKLTQEQMDYILSESTELFELHNNGDFKQYCVRKGILQNYIGDIIPHGGAEGFTNWVRSSLLLGTRTIFKNSGSNLIDSAYHSANKINYTIYDKAINKLFGTGVRVAGISLDGQKAGFKAGVKTAIQSLNDIVHGTSTTEFGNRYLDSNTSRENITKDFFGTMPVRYQTKIRKLNDAANWVSQLSTNTMTFGDAKYAAASYEDNRRTLRKLNALEQLKADNSKGIIYDIKTDAAGTSHVDYINTKGQYSNAVTNDLEKFTKENNVVALKGGDRIDKLALEYSQSRTYTGDTTFSKTTNTILKAVDTAASKIPGLKQLGIKPTNFIVPFSKIGSNLCYKMYRGSILSIPSIKTAFDNFKAEVDSGQVSMKTQHELVSRLGDLTTGTILYTVMGSLAKAAFDNIEGDDDDEASKVSKFMKSIFGEDKYTFKVGDYNFSFDVGGNLTNMLKLSLDLQETSEKEDATFKDYTEVALKDILSEWTVANLTELFNDQYNSSALDNILQTAARVPSMAIPNFMKDIAMNVDNFTQRSVWDEDLGTYAINSIKAKIPPILEKIPGVPDLGISRASLPEKLDSWGNVMKNGDNLITQVWNTYIVGDQIKKDNSDPVSQELMEIYLITNQSSVIPNTSKSYFSYQSKRYDLNDEEEKQYLQVYAKSAHDNLDKLFSSSQYQNADTETRLKYINEIYDYANDEAKKDYLNTNNISYYNYGQKIIISGTNDTYKQAQILDAIDHNISYDSAKTYQKDEGKFKYYNSFGSYEAYDAISANIDDIRTTYSKANGYSDNQRKQQVINYVNSLNNLSAVQKAILIKEKYPASYKSYNEQIKAYLKKQNLDDETYQALLTKMKIN